MEVTGKAQKIDFAPQSALEEIAQNVRTILTTPKYSVPLDREFGLNATMLDAPAPLAKARLTAEIVEAVQRYEPRVKVERVTFEGDGAEGILRPKVRLKIVGA